MESTLGKVLGSSELLGREGLLGAFGFELMEVSPLAEASKHLLATSMSPWRMATSPFEVYYFIFKWTVEGTAISSARVGLPKMHWYNDGQSTTKNWHLMDLAVSPAPKVTIRSR